MDVGDGPRGLTSAFAPHCRSRGVCVCGSHPDGNGSVPVETETKDAPWEGWKCEVAFNAAKHSLVSFLSWIVDSGANTVVIPPTDVHLIEKWLPGVQLLKTSAGVVEARNASIRTPFGVRRGLVCDGAPRLLPAGDFDNIRSVDHVCMGDTCYRVAWTDGIPMLGMRIDSPSALAVINVEPVTASVSGSRAKRRLVLRKTARRKARKRKRKSPGNPPADECESDDGREGRESPVIDIPVVREQEFQGGDNDSQLGTPTRTINFDLAFFASADFYEALFTKVEIK